MTRSLFGSIKDKLSSSKHAEAFDRTPSQTADRQSRSATRTHLYADAPADSPPPYSARPPGLIANVPSYRRGASPANSNGLAPNVPPSRRSASPAPSLDSVTNDGDKYAFLGQFDTIFLIDDSSSMKGSRWSEVAAALQAITPICTARDKDGIDLYFLNHLSNHQGGPGRPDGGYYNITSASTVNRIFSTVKPERATPTGRRLRHILKPYVESLGQATDVDAVRPVNLIVITDGDPTDNPEDIIADYARKLDNLEAAPHQVGIQFFQVGSDQRARDALRELDDELAERGVRDMVDSVTWDETARSGSKVLTADHILKVVLGAVVRKLDRKDAGGR